MEAIACGEHRDEMEQLSKEKKSINKRKEKYRTMGRFSEVLAKYYTLNGVGVGYNSSC